MSFRATAALGSTGASGPGVIRRLLDILIDPDSFATLKGLAAVKLGQLGPTAEPLLLDLLAHPDRDIRTKAAGALGQGAFDRTQAIPNLVRLLDDDEESVRLSLAETLGRIVSQALPYLEEAVQTRTGRAVCYAADVLLTGRPDYQPAIRALVAHLDNHDSEVRRCAASFLEHAGPHGGAAVPRLVEALGDDDLKVRSFAAWSLGVIGLSAKEAEPPLVKALRDHDPVLRRALPMRLANCGRHPPPRSVRRQKRCAINIETSRSCPSCRLARSDRTPRSRTFTASAQSLAANDRDMLERIAECARLIGPPQRTSD